MLEAAVAAFTVSGPLQWAEPLRRGHIHDTFIATCRGGRRYLLQRLNRVVFPDPEPVLENIARVTAHLSEKWRAQGTDNPGRRTLSLVLSHDGRPYAVDAERRYWRAYDYIEDAYSVDAVGDPPLAYAAARAFGEFARLLADLPGPPLRVTIPHFHDTPRRLAALTAAVEADRLNRAGLARSEIDRTLGRASLAAPLADPISAGRLPTRTVHNDTKINNLLLDVATHDALCVVDLDTVMPGCLLHDFGDLVRSSASAQRDEAVGTLRLPLFEALTRGYLDGTGDMLDPEELDLLALSPAVITYELAMRFLTDYLRGDVYFHVDRPGQNLQRCRGQLALLDQLQRHAGAMAAVVERVRGARA